MQLTQSSRHRQQLQIPCGTPQSWLMGSARRNSSIGARIRRWLGRYAQLHQVQGVRLVNTTVECLACARDFPPLQLIQVPCKHFYCRSCFNAFVKTLLEDSATGFPLRCCNNEISIPEELIMKHCDPSVYLMYKTAQAIQSIPFGDRWYCPHSECRALTDKRTAFFAHGAIRCSKCQRYGCVSCKAPRSLMDHECTDRGTRSVIALSVMSGWQSCWQCGTMIEMSRGCRFLQCIICKASLW